MYSFISPRKKFAIDSFTYIWIFFIVITSVFLIGVGLYLDSKNSKFEEIKSEINTKIEKTKEDKKVLLKKIAEYKSCYKSSQSIKVANNNLKSGLQNLLLFVPEEIKINKMVLDKYEVKIYGITNSPKTYKLLLEPPLKSIFDSTKVGFTKQDDGTYLFSSYNKIKRVNNEKK